MPFDDTPKSDNNGGWDGFTPKGYKAPVKINPLLKLLVLALSMRHPESAMHIQRLFEEAFLNGVDYAVAEINARHGTQYTLE